MLPDENHSIFIKPISLLASTTKREEAVSCPSGHCSSALATEQACPAEAPAPAPALGQEEVWRAASALITCRGEPQDLRMWSDWEADTAGLSSAKGEIGREICTQSRRPSGRMAQEAGVGRMELQVQDWWPPLEGRMRQRCHPSLHLALLAPGSQASGLQEHQGVTLCGLKSPSVWSFVTATLGHSNAARVPCGAAF